MKSEEIIKILKERKAKRKKEAETLRYYIKQIEDKAEEDNRFLCKAELYDIQDFKEKIKKLLK